MVKRSDYHKINQYNLHKEKNFYITCSDKLRSYFFLYKIWKGLMNQNF